MILAKFNRKLGKGLYLINIRDILTQDEHDRMFIFAKARKSRTCIVTDAKIEKGDNFYMKFPARPELSISVFGMYMLRNNFDPEMYDFTAQFVAENLNKLYNKLDEIMP